MPLRALSTTPVEHCELCHSTHFTEVANKDREGKKLRTVICENCGLVFSDPRPASTQIDDFYREGYRMAYKQAWQPRLKHTYRAGKVAQGRLRHLMPLLAPGSRVLDFGSGGGELVFILRELGHDARGIEPNIGYAEYSRDVLGIPVQIGGFAEARVEPRNLDLVTLFHVAEHLEHPVHALKIVAGWLREGGQLLVEVPNVESRCIWPSSRFHQAQLYNFNPATIFLGDAGSLLIGFLSVTIIMTFAYSSISIEVIRFNHKIATIQGMQIKALQLNPIYMTHRTLLALCIKRCEIKNIESATARLFYISLFCLCF